MAAVTSDNGTSEQPAEFFKGPDYLNWAGIIRTLLYRLYLPLVNRRVRQLRQSELNR